MLPLAEGKFFPGLLAVSLEKSRRVMVFKRVGATGVLPQPK